jgi:hypothetical protein
VFYSSIFYYLLSPIVIFLSLPSLQYFPLLILLRTFLPLITAWNRDIPFNNFHWCSTIIIIYLVFNDKLVNKCFLPSIEWNNVTRAEDAGSDAMLLEVLPPCADCDCVNCFAIWSFVGLRGRWVEWLSYCKKPQRIRLCTSQSIPTRSDDKAFASEPSELPYEMEVEKTSEKKQVTPLYQLAVVRSCLCWVGRDGLFNWWESWNTLTSILAE